MGCKLELRDNANGINENTKGEQFAFGRLRR